jgi:peptidyl-prolyl cis-trans isomerase D
MALAFMRRHRSILNWLLVLVIASFIYFYIPTFLGPTQGSLGEALGTVGGLPITVGEFQKTYLQARQRYERIYQGQLNAEALKALGIENQVFDGLVAERVVLLEAKRLGLSVTDEEVAHEIATSPSFQQNGRFVGADQIRRYLESTGTTVEEFEQQIRADLLRRRLEAVVTSAVTVTPAEAEREFRRRTEQIKGEYVLVDTARFRSQVSATDAGARARFESRKEAYKLPQRRVVSYVLVDPEALQARAAVTDREIEVYFGEHKEEFVQPEEVCASHILVKAKAHPEDTEGHTDAEAKKIAEDLLGEVKAGGDFAAIAKARSEDKGSASRGGDLGCFQRGSMVPEFDEAAFSLAPGQTSDLVKTSFGYHIIRVASHHDETTPALSQVKERIRSTLLGQKASALADEKVAAMGAALRHGTSLEDAAKDEGLVVSKSAPFARGETPAPLSSPALVARAFDLRPKQAATEPFPVAHGTAFISLDEIQAPRQPQFEEVKEKIKAEIIEEDALARAKETAATLEARARKDGLEKAATALGLVRKETSGFVSRGSAFGDLGSSVTLDEAAFSLPEKTLSEPIPVTDGYAVFRITEKHGYDPQAFESQKASLIASLESAKKGQLFQAYMSQARGRVEVDRRPDLMKRVAG